VSASLFLSLDNYHSSPDMFYIEKQKTKHQDSLYHFLSFYSALFLSLSLPLCYKEWQHLNTGAAGGGNTQSVVKYSCQVDRQSKLQPWAERQRNKRGNGEYIPDLKNWSSIFTSLKRKIDHFLKKTFADNLLTPMSSKMSMSFFLQSKRN